MNMSLCFRILFISNLSFVIANTGASESVNILVSTFNVNAERPNSLRNWITIDSKSPPHLIAIGIQEMDPLDKVSSYISINRKHLVSIGNNKKKEKKWINMLEMELSDYEMIASKKMVGIWLAVFARRNRRFKISDIREKKFAIPGLLPGGLGNKGAVRISFSLHDVRLCFVNSHLTAGQKQADKRADDALQIYEHLVSGEAKSKSSSKHSKRNQAIFWFGDLNFRLNTEKTREEVIGIIKDGNFAKLLLPTDQLGKLKTQNKAGNVLANFIEHPIAFKPTYKYDPGTRNWDSSAKKRIPAWCDRILYTYDRSVLELEQLSYTSAENVMISDHRPVIGTFSMQLF